VPDRRAREARDDLDAELGRRAGGVLHPLGGALPDALGIAVPPHLRREDRLVALVDRIAHRLPNEVVADGVALEPVALQQLSLPGGVVRLRERAVDLEVVAPGRQLEAVEAPLGDFGGQLLERDVGPLAGEQRDGSRHARSCPLLCVRPRRARR
jgi:hypothetical protein